jgi:arginase family enzyme
MHLKILDLDGALDAQLSLRDVAPWQSVQHIALRDLGARLRLWSTARVVRAVRARLQADAAAAPAVHLLGSGDFHHLAVLLMEQAREPITIVHIDNHPDWVRLAPRWHCGSWVNQALRLPQVARVITLGVCSEDLVRPDLKGGNLPALSAGRIALFPWQHAPSRVWGRIAQGAGHRYEHGRIHWRNLAPLVAERGVAGVLDAIIPLIETDAIWFSIDKDVLPEADAVTNWDQGQMPLPVVVELIRELRARKRIAGADICGEYSPPQHRNWFKRWEARMDQPQRDTFDTTLRERNENTNRQLLEALAAC